MRILFIGDIVGECGRNTVAGLLPKLLARESLDFVIANAENAAGGSSVTSKTASQLFKAGCDCLTSGDHIFRRPEVLEIIDTEPRLLRPANLAKGIPGRGFGIFQKGNISLAVINLQGRVFMPPSECPFRTAAEILQELKEKYPDVRIIFVDIHAEATSEKKALGYFLDGQVSAVAGTHTHIQTADEIILAGGSAYITDAGMTGAQDSVIGRKKEKIIEHFLTGMPARFELATENAQLQGVVVEVDDKTGKAVSIKRVQEKLEV